MGFWIRRFERVRGGLRVLLASTSAAALYTWVYRGRFEHSF